MNLIALDFNNHRIARKCMSYFTLCGLPQPLPQKLKGKKGQPYQNDIDALHHFHEVKNLNVFI